MKTVDKIVSSTNKMYEELKNDNHGRYKSWEQCYTSFYDARGKKEIDYDYLSLILAFYLASWGMYRGSSFLLQRDYTVHIPVVEEIMKSKYDRLVGIKCIELKNPEIRKLIFKDLQSFLEDYYRKERKKVFNDEPKNKISDTLITKILMGTLACVPAYDRYFIDGIKHEKVSTGNYNEKSILKIVDFYEENNDILEKTRKKMRIDKRDYPQMKMLDMGFWYIGFSLNK